MKNQLTQKDVKRIKNEIEYRKLVVRREALEAVKEARAQGDLNVEFRVLCGKKGKNQNEEPDPLSGAQLKNSVVVSDTSRADEVGLNNTVTLYCEDDDEEEVYKLVTSVRGNSLNNYISTESPIGRAILGHKVGDRVHIKVSDSYEYDVEIRKIENTGDDGTDKLRSF